MKKLITIILIITLNSCSTEDENREESTPSVEEYWYKLENTEVWQYNGVTQPLRPQFLYYKDECGYVLQRVSSTGQWRVGCR
jgi:hypothetical protein